MEIIKVLLVLGVLVITGCASTQTKNPQMFVQHIKNIAPEELCKQKEYRSCMASDTYSQCIYEVRTYESVCSRDSFLNTSTEQGAKRGASAYMVCLSRMHGEDKGVTSSSPHCINYLENND